MKSTILTRAVAAALLAGLSCPARAQGSTAALNKADQHILSELAQANLAEIEAGKIAEQKSNNDQVKSFAQQMIDDHGKALQDVQQLAQARGVTLPTEPDRKHKVLDDKLAKLSGAAFDQAYLARAGVKEHQQAHKFLAKSASKASDPDLKALVAKMQPTVDQHLNRVEQLAQANRAATSGSSGTRGSTGSGNVNQVTSGNTDSPLDPNNPATHPVKPKPTNGQ